MMDTKVTTVIVNATTQALVMKVGTRPYYAKLTSVKVGGEYRMQLDVNWTYQEYVVQNRPHAHNPLLINSDDCCDYERITIQDVGGKFKAQKHLRDHFQTSCCSPIFEEEESDSLSTWKSRLYKFMFV